MDRLTLILPTYNRRHVLERTWWCYAEIARSHRVLVIDDGSQDGTCAWLRDQGANVVRRDRRHGLPAARNLGLRLATTRWVLFGEDDVLFAPGHAERLLIAATRLQGAGAIAGRLHARESWTLPDQEPAPSPGPLLDPVRLLGAFSAPLAHALPLPSLHACALVNRSAALAIGGYDESFSDSAFREESDFYARMWRSGHPSWLIPDTWAVHVCHRLGGGCRGRTGWLAKAGNRLSYWRNNARFADRHQRLWARWGAVTPPGTIKGLYAREILKQALRR